MEEAIRAALAPHVAALAGASLSELRCHATACRLAVELTPALKARLDLEAPDGVGFATDRLVGSLGAPLARASDALWDDEEVPAWVRLLGDLGSWLDRERHRRLTRETTILMFDEGTHDPAGYAARIAAVRARRAAAR
jgi:hypothetical protein